MNVCAGWDFPIERDTFEVSAIPPPPLPSPGMISRVIIKLPHMHDIMGKRLIGNKCFHRVIM